MPEDGDYNLGEYVARAIFADPEFTKTESRLGSLTDEDGTFFENLDPYIPLRLLAENPQNLDQHIVWAFADIVEGGWVTPDELYEGVPDENRWLIVTEGSSDGSVANGRRGLR